MRIAIVIGGMRGGGAERVVSELANKFAESGHQITIITTATNVCVYKLEENVNMHFIDISKSIMGLRFFKRVIHLRKYVNIICPDIVFSFTAGASKYAILSTLASKYKIIVSERNNPYQDPSNKIDRIIRDTLYNFADGFVFQTEDAKNYFPLRIRKRGTVIANPINNSLPDPFDGERKKEIVTVLRLEPQKNVYMLIDAFEQITQDFPSYSLKIYGEGSLEVDIATYVKQKQLDTKVHLMGFSKDVYSEIKSAGMFVLPSNYEGMPNALIEAMAMGIPSIATDCPCGGPKFLINNFENGILIPVGDTEALAKAMTNVISNKNLSATIGHNAIRIRERLSVDKITKKWVEFAEKVKG